MRLLADENCDRLLVAALRDAGHDVAYVTETRRGESDEALFQLAADQSRAILTDDLDFGHLAELEQARAPAIILTRLGSLSRAARVDRVVAVLETLVADRQLVVIEPAQIRLRAFSRA
jgi:predicted nuclease of predicted toxin-antitoxin system